MRASPTGPGLGFCRSPCLSCITPPNSTMPLSHCDTQAVINLRKGMAGSSLLSLYRAGRGILAVAGAPDHAW
jgi:hypothetical protein